MDEEMQAYLQSVLPPSSWCLFQNAFSLHVSADTGERGVRCLRTLPANEVVFSFPDAIIMTPEKALAGLTNCSHCGPLLLHHLPTVPFTSGLQVLTAHLMHLTLCDCGDDQQDLYYVHSYLPQRYTLPLFCSSAALLDLLPRCVRNKVHCMQKALAEDFHRMFEPLFVDRTAQVTAASTKSNSSRSTLLDVYLWAFASVNTRVVYCKCSLPPRANAPHTEALRKQITKDHNVAIVTVFDMFNHSPAVRTTCQWNGRTNCLDLILHETVQAGDEVCIHYGAHDNVTLFVQYGFTLPHNPHNYVPIHSKCLEAVLGPKSGHCIVDSLRALQSTSSEESTGVGLDADVGPSFLLLVLLYSGWVAKRAFTSWDDTLAIVPHDEMVLRDCVTVPLRQLVEKKLSSYGKKKVALLIHHQQQKQHHNDPFVRLIGSLLEDFLTILRSVQDVLAIG